MTEESVQTSAQTESSEAVLRLLTQMVEDAPNLQAIAVGYVRKDGAAAVRHTPMPTAMLAHLARIFDMKVDREYMSSMLQQQAPPVRPTPAQSAPPISQAVRASLHGKGRSKAKKRQ